MTTTIELLAQWLNEADDHEVCVADLCREHGSEVVLQVIQEAHQQRWRNREVTPALSLLEGFSDGTWAVTLNDYGPGADEVSSILSFNTREEALAFIDENSGAHELSRRAEETSDVNAGRGGQKFFREK